jgi:hypothetical protein
MSILLDGLNGITSPSGTVVSLTTTGNTIIGDATTDTLNVGAGGLVKDASGNVGIGTGSPGAKLDVTNNQAALSYLIDTNNTTNGGSSIWRMITRNIANTGTTSVEFYKPTGSGFGLLNNDTNASNFTSFNVGASERMRIDSSGNLLVGTTTIGFTNSRSFNFQGLGDGKVYVNHSTANSSGDGYIGFGYNGGQIGSITQNGTTAVAYNTSSDYRLKENIAPMTGALSTVSQLKPVTYSWKADGSDGQGFIAHELQAVVPDCVTGEKDATREEEYEVTPAVPVVVDAEGVETTPAVQAVKGTRTVPSYQGIDTSFLVATLTAAIQELKAIVDAQAVRIAALEA